MADPRLLKVKILSYKSPQRYAVRRTLNAALSELRKIYPGAELEIIEIKEIPEMRQFTEVLILPSLLVGDNLVCIGRFPKKAETVGWLRDEIERLADLKQIR